MPLAPASFASSRRYATPGAPAVAHVVVFGPTGTAGPVTHCRVDTGADLTILPMAMATAVGITPTISVTFTTVTGAAVTLLAAYVTLEIDGNRPSTTRRVAFSSASATPVVGFQDLLSATEFGFDISAWHFD